MQAALCLVRFISVFLIYLSVIYFVYGGIKSSSLCHDTVSVSETRNFFLSRVDELIDVLYLCVFLVHIFPFLVSYMCFCMICLNR